MASWGNELSASCKGAGVLTSIFVDRVWRSDNQNRNRMKSQKGKFASITKGIDEYPEGALPEVREMWTAVFPISNLFQFCDI